MSKVVIPPLGNPESSSFVSQLNSAIDTLSDEFEKVIYRDGSFDVDGPIDMGGNRLYNLPSPLSDAEPVRLADLFGVLQGPPGDLATSSTRTALAAVTPVFSGLIRRLTEYGIEGDFVFSTANLSTAVAADTEKGIYVAPNSDPTGASGAWVRRTNGAVVAEWFGVTGNGTTVDNVKLQKALNTGLPVILKNNRVATYLIGSGLTHVTGSGLICLDGIASLKAKTGTGGFTNKDTTAPRTGLDRNMYLVNGTDNLTIYNVEFSLDGVSEVQLGGIRLFGGLGTVGYNIRAAFANFDAGSMISVGGAGGGRYRNIHVLYAVNSGISGATGWSAGSPQTTVVEIDNDRPSTTASVGGRIQIDFLQNILHSGAALTTFGMETDGINIVHQGANSTTNWTGHVEYADGVGELLDIQGFNNNFTVGHASRTHNDMFKITHGGSGNTIVCQQAEKTGRSMIYIAGSDSPVADRDIRDNVVIVHSATDLGTYGLGLTGETSAILYGNITSTRVPKENFCRINMVHGDGTSLDYIVRDGGADNNLNNIVEIGRASGWAIASVNAPKSNVRVKSFNRDSAEMTMSASQSIPSATATKLAFNTVANDTNGLAVTASNKFTVKWPGTYRVEVQVRADAWATGTNDQWTLEVRQSNSPVGVTKGKIFFSGKDETPKLIKDIYIDENDVGTANADITFWLTHDTTGSKTVTNTAGYTYATITKVD